MQVTANTTKATKATSTPATKAKATATAKGKATAPTPAPTGLAAQAAAIMAATAAQPAAPTATAKVRAPAHTGGVFGHLCTVGRRQAKCWYATGSAGYNIGALLCQHAAAGRKAAVAAAVAAGFSAGSATSCWGDMQAFNTSLQLAGLASLQTAYANVVPASHANGVTANA